MDLGLRRQAGIVASVALLNNMQLPTLDQSLKSIFAYRLQHPEPCFPFGPFALAQEALVDEGGKGIKWKSESCMRDTEGQICAFGGIVPRHRCRGFQCATPDEDAQTSEVPLLLRIEVPVAPLYSPTQGVLARG